MTNRLIDANLQQSRENRQNSNLELNTQSNNVMNLHNNTIRINLMKDIDKDNNIIEDENYGAQDGKEIFESLDLD